MVDTSGALNPIGAGEFRIGAVISRTFSTFGRNWGGFLLIAGVASLPYLYLYWTQGALVNALRQQATPDATLALAQQASSHNGLTNLISLFGSILSIIAQAAIIDGAFGAMSGRELRPGESVRAGLRRFWPFFGLGLILGIGIALGFVLLVVPGFMLLTMWFVAIPACVVEKLGPLKSLNRSAALTRGHRWQLLGLIVLLLVGYLIVGGSALGLLFFTGTAGFSIGEFLFHVVAVSLGGIFTASVYHDLRIAKEGMGAQTIAAAFE